MKKLVLIVFLLNSFFVVAQGEANFWFFGQFGGLDFNNGTATPISGNLNTNEGCASFSTSDGRLLFYTDGITVWDRNNNVMPRGNNLKGNPSSTQSAIIVPHPGNANLYYIFTVGANDYDNDGNLIKATDGLYAYTVDMTLNSGLGDIILGSQIKLSGNESADWTEKITSVKGSDCNTFWVISFVNNKFVSFKVDLNGLNTTPVQSQVNYYSLDPRGYLKVSPDGSKIASATFGRGDLHLYSFNNSTGIVANDGISLIVNPSIDGYSYGVEFSPNSSKLYCSTYGGSNSNVNKLFQFDLNSANIPFSKFLVNSEIGYRGGLQLAPNGKIYATVPPNYSNGTQFLNAINSPDALGIACDFSLKAINLGANGRAMQGLPPFIASLLIPVEITDGTTTQNINGTIAKRCIGENYKLEAQNIQGNPTYKWTFNRQVVSNTANLELSNLSILDEGTYYFEAETIDDCGFKILYSGEVTIEVYEPPTITKPSDILECDNDNDGYFSFDLNDLRDSEVLSTQDPKIFEVKYYTNLTDAINGENEIVMPYVNSAPYSTETLIARIQNIYNPICFETESFTLQLSESPNPPATISNYSVCDSNQTGTDSDGIELFDLTSKEIEILNGQNASNFTFTYLKSSDLSIISNPTSYKNTTAHLETIQVLISNINNSNCNLTTSFNLEIYSLPTIVDTFIFKQCDEDGVADGFTDFNLNEANDYLTLNDNSLTVTYFLSKSDAETNSNPIVASPFSNQTQASITARIENSNRCYRIATVNLLVSSTDFPVDFLKTVTHCDDDNIFDGLNLFDLSENDSDFINALPSGQNLTVTYYRNLADAQLEVNEIPKNQPYLSEVPFSQTLYVRVESSDNGECFGLGPHLKLEVNPRPDFDLIETDIYCINLPPKTVSIQNPNGNYTYSWTNENGVQISDQPSATIIKEGVYTVVATSIFGCESFPKILTVEPSIVASISEDDINITDDSVNNTITISTSNLGIGDYEFSLDDDFLTFQDEPYFENVPAGIHTIYIQDKNGCGVAQIEVSVIGFPRFFTPNNDGHNDTWEILGVNENFYSHSVIYIFDRYGKLITQIDPKGNGWNGLYNGEELPESDYWFTAELIDANGVTRIRKGHFSLIR